MILASGFITIILVPVLNPIPFRRRLLGWYASHARKLPWRATKDPYAIWVSEIMLQQTRAAVVVPYFERFLKRFPDVEALARAGEQDVLRAWSGLGYYGRARNLRRAARMIAAQGRFPSDYDAIRALPGAGEYTAAAVASIAFGLPHAAVDGNVVRVLSRLACRSEGLADLASRLLDRRDPGRYNQALMELGATVCLPAGPGCGMCPVAGLCEARRQGRVQEFPARRRRQAPVRVAKTLLVVEKQGKLLLRRRDGFWELPGSGDLPAAAAGQELRRFRHSIMNRSYLFTVVRARLPGAPDGFRWVGRKALETLPLATVARKALGFGNTRRGSLVNS
jgi:A/G-specific adenine glycosylase